jgi:hypothetical protein
MARWVALAVATDIVRMPRQGVMQVPTEQDFVSFGHRVGGRLGRRWIKFRPG